MRRDLLRDMGYDEYIVFEDPDYDDVIIGVTESGQVVYDYDLMIESLIAHDGMSYEDAADFISYNTVRALGYMGERAPVIIHRIWEQ